MNEEFNDNQFDNERMNRGNNDDTFEGDALKEANKVTDLKKNQKKVKTASKVISLTAAFSGALLVALGVTNIFSSSFLIFQTPLLALHSFCLKSIF